MIDKSLFKVNERNGEYYAEFRVSGTIYVEFQASSLEDAEKKADAMCEDPEFGQNLDDADEIDVVHVGKQPPMYLVKRDGKIMQTSRILEGDEPREPDERGF